MTHETDFKQLAAVLSDHLSQVVDPDERTGSDRTAEAKAGAGALVAAVRRLVEAAACWPSGPDGIRPDKRRAWGTPFDATGRCLSAVASPVRVALHAGPAGVQVAQDLNELRELVAQHFGEDAAGALAVDAGLVASLDALEARIDELDHVDPGQLLGAGWPERTGRAIERFAIDSGVSLPRAWSRPVVLADITREIGGRVDSLVTWAQGRGVRLELFRGAWWVDLADLIDRGGFRDDKLKKLQEM